MCLILFAHNSHPKYPFVVAANRDEFYQRPTRAAAFWPATSDKDLPFFFAGQDLVHGGTWMGITLSGRFAAVTNYRGIQQKAGSHQQKTRDHLSRGILVKNFLEGEMKPQRFATEIMENGERYGGFNLLLKDADSFWYCSNRALEPFPIEPGIHGLSNHLLDTEWPKVRSGKTALGQNLEHLENEDEIDLERLFDILQDRSVAHDSELPDTGFGTEKERMLSPTFITSPTYGTRSSTVLLVDNDGNVTFIERNFEGPESSMVENRHSFVLIPAKD